MNYRFTICLLLSALTAPAGAQSLGSTFTYQGQLTESGQPATGLYDLQACLYESSAAASPIACAPDLDDVPVEDGLFTIALDFGTSVFAGQERYLELRVRPGDGIGSFTPLLPRQLVRATPEALRASEAGIAATAPWSGLTGVPAGFSDGVDDDSGGTVTSVTAGTGLAGGTITDSGILEVAPGGIGAAQIDPAEVQARITDSCPASSYFAGVNADGSVFCGSALTSVTAGSGLTGGTITDSGTIGLAPGGVGAMQIDSAEVQARVTGECPPGSYFEGINADGSVSCDSAVTSVTAGTGLTGGTITDSGTIALAEGGVGSAQIDSSEVQTRVTGVCPIGSYLRGINADGSTVCSELVNQTTLQLVDGRVGSVGDYTSIAIGADGLPVISYFNDSGNTLKVAKCSTLNCSNATISTVDGNANGTWTSIAIGNDDLPVISYRDLANERLKVAKCNDPACAGGDEIITRIDSSSDVGRYTSIAIGPDGFPAISYTELTVVGGAQNVFSLRVAKCNDAACIGGDESIATVDSDGTTGVMTSIAIGADGLPIISYRDNSAGALNVAKCNDSACSGGDEEITAVDGSVAGLWTDIAIGLDGLPVISYHDGTAQILKIAKCNDVACAGGDETISNLDISSDVGRQTSIAVGADGLPIISYKGGPEDNLKIAKCNDPACSGNDETIRTLDNSDNDVGEYSSIAIDPDGLPVISYHDVTAGDLKVAKCGTPSCR